MRMTLLALAAFALPVLAADAEKDWSHHTGKVPFVVGYQAGLDAAAKDKKPVMLFLTTTWCGWCKKLGHDVFADDEVVKALSGWTCVIVDGDVEKEALRKYGVRGFPAIRFLDAEANEVGKIGGYVPKEKFLGILQDAASKLKK